MTKGFVQLHEIGTMGRLQTLLLAASIPAAAAALFWFKVAAGPKGPIVEYQPIADLGEREFGEVAVAKLSFTNAGDERLEVSDIATSAGCSCTGLEREAAGHLSSVKEFSLEPGAVERFVLRLAIREPPGSVIRYFLRFRTNDPRRRHGEIELLVPSVRGLSFAPTSVVFGDVGRGQTQEQVISVANVGTDPVEIDKVVSSDPDVFRVAVETPDPLLKPAHQPGQAVARLRVTMAAQSAGKFDGNLMLYVLRGDKPYNLSIAASARVVMPVTAYPTRIVLPRKTIEGPVYQGTFLLKSSDGKPFDLDLSALPEGFRGNIQGNQGDEGVCLLRIDCRGWAETLASGSGSRRLELPATCASGDTVVEVEIEVAPVKE